MRKRTTKAPMRITNGAHANDGRGHMQIIANRLKGLHKFKNWFTIDKLEKKKKTS